MPPRSFVSSVYCASPGREAVEIVREHALQERVRPRCRRPAPGPCARRRRRRPRCARRAPRRSRPRTAPASPNRRRGRGARPIPRGGRTAACAVARPAPRRTLDVRVRAAHEARPRARARWRRAPRPALIAPIVAQERELVAQVGAHHLGAVRRDGHAHARVEERAEHPAHLVGVVERAGQEVRGRADLEHDAGLGDQGGQLGDRPRRGCRGRCDRAAAPRPPRPPPRR